MPTALYSFIFVILFFHVPVTALAAGGDASDVGPQPAPLTPAPGSGPGQALSLQGRGDEKGQGRGSSEAPPEACRDCGGLQYFPPDASGRSAPLTPAISQGERGKSRGTSGGPAQLQRGHASKRAHLSSDPRVRTARTLIGRERFDQALTILRKLPPDHPDQTDVKFLLGLAASRGSQDAGLEDEERLALLDEAIAAFRSILIKRPDLVRVRLELALAFYLKEDDQLAREHFERALVGKPPPALVANVVRFLSIMRARRRWTGYFGFSLAPDTNINAASDADAIYINGLRFDRGQTGRVSSGIGIVGWGGAEYQYPLAARWRLRAGLDVNHRDYTGGQFDQTFVGGFVGPRWLISSNTEMSLLAASNQRWFGGNPFNWDIGARLEVLHRLFAGLLLNGRATWQDRTYQQQKFLEGPVTVFSLGATYVLLPTVSVNALAGFQHQDTRLKHWTNTGYWGRVGTNVALPFGFTVGLSAEFRWTNYDGRSPFVPDLSSRRDRTRVLGATLLNRAITVYGFSPQVAYSNQVRETNAPAFDFKRDLVELRWVRQF